MVEDFGYNYSQFAAAGFPLHAFVHPRFNRSGPLSEDLSPTFQIHVYWIEGGLLLSVAYHHAFSDAECARMFLEAFAAQTRHETIQLPRDCVLILPETPMTEPKDFETLAKKEFTDYALLPDKSGPLNIVLSPGGADFSGFPSFTGTVFEIEDAKIKELSQSIHNYAQGRFIKPPSSYVCLAALTWAFVVKARMEAEQDKYCPENEHGGESRMLNNVNFRSKIPDESGDYWGDAAAALSSYMALPDLIRCCDEDLEKLTDVVETITATIETVDRDYVLRLRDLYAAAGDPRRLGFKWDPRTPQNIGFTTWRYAGADSEWNIPGVFSVDRKPDAIAPASPTWAANPYGLILPAKSGATIHKLFLGIPKISMEALKKDKTWMGWVSRVVE
ncbi:uncharacterized protein PG998_010477 [Apiospora kogelbergensis]|uniref:uncharacterized protein n=1 Tax=Apiospora kogelbergensis TaxID=1337665 RepID=UPI003131C65A